MRRTIIRMIASDSLSAFSVSAQAALTGTQSPRPLQVAQRSDAASRPQAAPAPLNLPALQKPPINANAPRGSLLNLTV